MQIVPVGIYMQKLRVARLACAGFLFGIPQSGVTNVEIIVYDFGSDRVGSALIKVR